VGGKSTLYPLVQIFREFCKLHRVRENTAENGECRGEQHGNYHRDTYLEQQKTEKIETEVRDVERIRITNVYACCPGWPYKGVIRALQSDINICYPPQPSAL
jgi:hypothetical protein